MKKITILTVLSICFTLLISERAVLAKSNEKKKELMEAIIVTATRTEKPISQVANTVSVIDAEQVQREIANGIDELVRYEPGVSVSGGGRFGLSGFTIRGISGDRVLTLVDGTPTADEFSFGPFLSSRRDFVDVDALKSIEIVRGPGSSVYGSNALGGVVNFITKSPTDYLNDSSLGGSIKVGTSSVDSSFNTTGLLAFGNNVLSGLVVATYRDSKETDTFFDDNEVGSQRNSLNPQNNENVNLYAKIQYQPNEDHQFYFVTERFRSESETEIVSAIGDLSRGVLTVDESAMDERVRERYSLQYKGTVDTFIFDTVNALLYYQESDSTQDTFRTQRARGALFDRTRESLFEQENIGFRFQLQKEFSLAGSQHQVNYGVDYDVNDSATLREGMTVHKRTGVASREFVNFPTRDFPISEYSTIGIFLQDEITLFSEKLRLIPAIRYDDFSLTPRCTSILNLSTYKRCKAVIIFPCL